MTKSYIMIVVGILFVFWTLPLQAQQPPTIETPHGQHELKSIQAQNRTEGEIIAFLIATSEHEMAVANDASQRKSDPRIAEYAQLVIKDHQKLFDETNKLSDALNIHPIYTQTIERLKSESDIDLARLSQLQGANFDHAYINQMVKDHTRALNNINNYYRKMTENAQLQSHLLAVGTTVAAHLTEASRIQQSMNSN